MEEESQPNLKVLVEEPEFSLESIRNCSISPLSPEFIEWFVDVEGLFAVYLTKTGNPKLSFRVTLHMDDLDALKFIQKELGAGVIALERNTFVYYMVKGEDIEDILFPIFDSFPLNSTKHMDYLIFKKAHFIRKDRS